jgi:hypothetical protein
MRRNRKGRGQRRERGDDGINKIISRGLDPSSFAVLP